MKPVHEEEPTWTKLSLIYVDKLFVKMPTNGDKFPKTPGSTRDEEVAGEGTGIGGNDTGRNVPFFEI